ncbi:MAG: succinylglutamate desuccinylase/aspartoacylase family protein [Anaerolineae bacterium]
MLHSTATDPGSPPPPAALSHLPPPMVPTPERVLGEWRDEAPAASDPGPTLIVIAGVHGNEPAGVHAARRVLAELARTRPAFRGRFVAISGNRRALASGKRFIDRDLNRHWSASQLAAARERVAAGTAGAEDREQVELAAALDPVLQAAKGRVFIVDCHSTSSQSAPFMLFADTLVNREFAAAFPLPLVLGLEEQIDGAIFDHYQGRGVVTLGVEGGQHASPEAVDNVEAVIWLALRHAGCLPEMPQAEAARHQAHLREARGSVPWIVEVRYRHGIRGEDAFRMRPGYVNFQPVESREHLADDRRGPVRAPEGGHILMPLYQGQGDDGFFMTRPVKPIWLALSARLRRRRLGWAVKYLPGVSRDPADRATLRIDTRVARFYPMEVFHLLGYRRMRREGRLIYVTRRLHDRPGE